MYIYSVCVCEVMNELIESPGSGLLLRTAHCLLFLLECWSLPWASLKLGIYYFWSKQHRQVVRLKLGTFKFGREFCYS